MVQSNRDSSIDPVWVDFLQKRVNSFVKWDLVRFFHDNPHTTESAENIARYIGRDVRTVRRELDGLVQTEVLEKREVTAVGVYELTADDSIREMVNKFVEACHDREFRVQAINHVIRGMGLTPRHDF